MAFRFRIAPWALVLASAAICVAAYARALHGEFQWDDFHGIVENPDIRRLDVFAAGFLARIWRSGRPVTDLTFALNHAAGGLDPVGFHAVNLGIHVVAVALVFAFTHRVLALAGRASLAWPAAVVASLFALHPIQSEAVSYAVQRSEVLSSALYLTALLLLLSAERAGVGWRGVLAWTAGLAVFVLGLGSKMVVVTLPFAYLLLFATVRSVDGRLEFTTWPRRLALVAPWILVDAWFAFVTVSDIEHSADAGFHVPGAPPTSYFLTQWRVIPVYLRLLAWPAGQNVDWMFPMSRSLLEPAVLLSGAALAALAALAVSAIVRGRRGTGPGPASARLSGFGFLWFLLLLAPTSSFAALADPLAEHRLYLASWGIFLAVTVLGERALALVPSARRVAVASVAVAFVLGGLTVALHQRIGAWETRLALWSDSAEKAPHNWRAHLQVGIARIAHSDFPGAIEAFRSALSVGGARDAADEAQILDNLGVALLRSGRPEEAGAALRRATSLDPGNATAFFNLAVIARARGDLAEAERMAARSVALRPRGARGLNLLGEVLLQQGHAEGTIELFQRALAADPGDPGPRFNIGYARARLGDRDGACRDWGDLGRNPRAPAALRERANRFAADVGCPASR